MAIPWVPLQRANEAEVLAILYCVEIESDFVLAVGLAEGLKLRPWKLTNELNIIDYLMLLVSCSGIAHILREGNVDRGCLGEGMVF